MITDISLQRGYPVETKIKVVEEWLTFGNLKLVAERNGIHYQTAKEWKVSKWWKEFEDDIQANRRIATQNKIGGIVDSGLDVVQDRLEQGDFFYDVQSGEVKRRPVSLRDAATAVNGLMQRQAILEKQNSQFANKEQTKTIAEQLTLLASEFAKFTKRNNSSAEDIPYKEISYAIESPMVIETRESGEDAAGTEEVEIGKPSF